jgi:Domain of unknown function (DUF4157)
MTGRATSMAAPEHEPIQAEPALQIEPDTGGETEQAARAPVAGLAVRRLEVGSAHDAEEHRADAVADRVVEALAADDAAAGIETHDHGGHLHVRRSSSGGAGTIGAAGGELGQADSDLIAGNVGRGTPLSGASKQRLSRAMGGADLNAVRIHSGPEAKALNERMSAAAFTVGTDIYFRDGAPDLSTGPGRRILAHELAHAVQADCSAHRLVDGPDDEKSGAATDLMAEEEKAEDESEDTSAATDHGRTSDSDTDSEHEEEKGEEESEPSSDVTTGPDEDKMGGGSGLASDLEEEALEDEGTDLDGSETDSEEAKDTGGVATIRHRGGKKDGKKDEKKDKKPGFFTKLFNRGGGKKLDEEKQKDPEPPQLTEEEKQKADEAEKQRKAEQAQQEIDGRTKDFGAIGALTLAELEKYVTDTPDWGKHSSLTKERPARIQMLVTFAGEAESGACPYSASDLLGIGTTASKMTTTLDILRTYGAAVQNDPFPISQAGTATDAIEIGKDLRTLLGAFPRWVLSAAMTEDTFNELRTIKAIDEVIAYYTGGTMRPTFQAEDGADFQAYLRMRINDKVNPVTYQSGELKDYIRNFHRFEARLLDRLIVNFKDTSKKKPLTLVLHSALDHNGAFHRDPQLYRVVNSKINNTLMVEGGETLDSYKSQITPLTRTYGVNDKLDQVMFAGHGNAQLIEMAGGVKEDSKGRLEQSRDDLDVSEGSPQKAKTEELFDEVLSNMDGLPNLKDPKQPHRRILFNACLTNSNVVERDLDGDEANARKQIREWIAKNMSLATFLNDRAKNQKKDVTALGANASIGQVKLIDSKGGLDMVTTADPKVTAPKLEYAEHGKEPTGVLRAAVESFGMDRDATITAMQNRIAAGFATFEDLIIIAAYDEFLNGSNPGDAHAIDNLRFQAEMAEDIAHLKSPAIASLEGLRGRLMGGWGDRMLDAIIQYADEMKEPKAALMIHTARLATDRTDPDLLKNVMDCLNDPSWTVKTVMVDEAAGRYLDIELLNDIGVLPDLLKDAPTHGKLVLALAGHMSDTKPVECTDYLKGLVKPGAPEVRGLDAVGEVKPVPPQKAPRGPVAEVPMVPGRAKVPALDDKRKEFPLVPDLPKLDALPAVPAPKDKKKTVEAPGRAGREARAKVDPVPLVEPYFDTALKIEDVLGGASTVRVILKSL